MPQASDEDRAKKPVRNYTMNSDGSVTIHGPGGDFNLDFGEFVMAYAPISFIKEIAEPI